MPRKTNKKITRTSTLPQQSVPSTQTKALKSSSPNRRATSQNALSSISVSIEPKTMKKDYSFKMEQNSQIELESANVQKDLSNVQNEYDEPHDKFPRQEDFFYQPDEYDNSFLRNEREEQQKNNSTNLSNVLFNNENSKKLKQVKDNG